jgi:hypothetical protein
LITIRVSQVESFDSPRNVSIAQLERPRFAGSYVPGQLRIREVFEA